MAFVGDYDIESVNRNIEQVGIVLGFIVTLRKHRLAPQQIDGHALNRADVEKRMDRLQVGRRHDLRVKLLAFFQVFTAETLAVDFVNLVKLQARFRLEGGEGVHGLRGEGAAVHKEKD